MIPRQLSNVLVKSPSSILLLGPRQTGKSTLIKSLNPEMAINLAFESEFLRFARDPDELPARLRHARPKTVFIDEVQRLPSLLNTIQALLDDAPKGHLKFFLTGSSARKLKRGDANLLPGRIIKYELGALSAQELDYAIDLPRALAYGTLPGIYLEDDLTVREGILDTYAATYLKEEIQAEALTRNIEGFSRFLFCLAARNSDFLDMSKLSSDAAVPRKTANRFLEILEETLLVHRVEAFSKSNYRRLIQHPRLFFFDNGVLNALLGGYDVTADRIGGLFETLVFNQLRTSAAAAAKRFRISTYRTENSAEVDLIVELGRDLWAIEVKASTNVGRSDLTGLKSFANFVGKVHKQIVIYLGNVEKNIDGVWVAPLSRVLAELFG